MQQICWVTCCQRKICSATLGPGELSLTMTVSGFSVNSIFLGLSFLGSISSLPSAQTSAWPAVWDPHSAHCCAILQASPGNQLQLSCPCATQAVYPEHGKAVQSSPEAQGVIQLISIIYVFVQLPGECGFTRGDCCICLSKLVAC